MLRCDRELARLDSASSSLVMRSSGCAAPEAALSRFGGTATAGERWLPLRWQRPRRLGLVGIYRGTQDQEICAQRSGVLELVGRRSLVPGDFYVLIPRPGSS
jgi:hypothetical protein